jgi:hypothetical protein
MLAAQNCDSLIIEGALWGNVVQLLRRSETPQRDNFLVADRTILGYLYVTSIHETSLA